MKLTKRFVETAQPQPGKDVFLWDGETRGFGLRIKPTGTKTFLVQYRNAENRSRRVALGKFGPLTVDAARKLAIQTIAGVYSGVDAAEEKRQRREGDTVADICEWYLKEARSGRLLGRMRRPIKQATLDMDESRIRTHILPLLGNRKISALRRSDIERFQALVLTGKTAKPRAGRGGVTTGGPGVASRAVGTLHSIFEHGIRYDLLEKNPAKGVRRHADTKRDRRLTLNQIGRFGTLLEDGKRRSEHPTALAAIEFALLSGFRRMEVLSLKQATIDFDAGVARLEETKTGSQVRVLGEASLALVKSQLEMHRSHVYVFPAASGEGHFVGAPRILSRLISGTEFSDITLHVLRHTFASVAADLGYSELTIRALLGHASRGITQRYVHVDTPLRAAADQTSASIANALSGL